MSQQLDMLIATIQNMRSRQNMSHVLHTRYREAVSLMSKLLCSAYAVWHNALILPLSNKPAAQAAPHFQPERYNSATVRPWLALSFAQKNFEILLPYNPRTFDCLL